MYKATIMSNGTTSVTVTGETTEELGEAIGAAIKPDPREDEVDVVYEVYGPLSRRMSVKSESDIEIPN